MRTKNKLMQKARRNITATKTATMKKRLLHIISSLHSSKTCRKNVDRIDVENAIIALYIKYNKNEKLTFQPINVRNQNNPYYIDAITYDHSARSKESLMIFASTGADDKILLRNCTDREHVSYMPAPVFKTGELVKLYTELKSRFDAK